VFFAADFDCVRVFSDTSVSWMKRKGMPSFIIRPMKHEYTDEQAKEMHRVLREIYEALSDKNTNPKPNNLNLNEISWHYGIQKLFSEMDETNNKD